MEPEKALVAGAKASGLMLGFGGWRARLRCGIETVPLLVAPLDPCCTYMRTA